MKLVTPATADRPASSRNVVYFNRKEPKKYDAAQPSPPPASAAPSVAGDAVSAYINADDGLNYEMASVLVRITEEEMDELLGTAGGAAD